MLTYLHVSEYVSIDVWSIDIGESRQSASNSEVEKIDRKNSPLGRRKR